MKNLHEHVDFFTEIISMKEELILVTSWKNNPPQLLSDQIIEDCEKRHPDYMSLDVRIKLTYFAIDRERISIDDILRRSLDVQKRRYFPGLMNFLNKCSDFEKQKIGSAVPNIVGERYLNSKKFFEASAL